MITFGPIPSRRLGKSLGINNIAFPKSCSYNCVYCQVGKTRNHTVKRETFYRPEDILREVEQHLQRLRPSDQPDYLTFVSNGEPTLDIRLGDTIRQLRELKIPVAVITNASLLRDEEVRRALMAADWLSVKVDAADEAVWRKLNRPVAGLTFDDYLFGIRAMAEEFPGTLCTESMLVRGYNDATEHLESLAWLLKELHPNKSYFAIPTRPPADGKAEAPLASQLIIAWQLLVSQGVDAELLTGFEGKHTGYTGNAFEDILNITAVHPLREDTMHELLRNDDADDSVLRSLLHMRLINKVKYRDKIFYYRQHPSAQ